MFKKDNNRIRVITKKAIVDDVSIFKISESAIGRWCRKCRTRIIPRIIRSSITIEHS